MLSKIEISNFKSARELSLELGNLTVLTGLNSSGKSSVIQAFRMLLQSQLNTGGPYLNGFGDFSELHSNSALRKSNIEMKILADEGSSLSLTVDSEKHIVNGSLDKFNYQYISADRLGPSSILPTVTGSSCTNVGDRGENVPDFYLNFSSVLIDKTLLHPSTASQTLEHQLMAWMGDISPNVSLAFYKESKHDISHIEIDRHRATNTGYGISYTLPIILSCLTMTAKKSIIELPNSEAQDWLSTNANNSPLLLIENPEAHLHPKGQTQLGKLVAKCANVGVQVVVETHSDHFIDGIRIAIKNGLLSEKKLNLYYLEKNGNKETEKTKIDVTNKGQIKRWPKGFFDQSLINLRELTSA